jgi:hypothetical protein
VMEFQKHIGGSKEVTKSFPLECKIKWGIPTSV